MCWCSYGVYSIEIKTPHHRSTVKFLFSFHNLYNSSQFTTFIRNIWQIFIRGKWEKNKILKHRSSSFCTFSYFFPTQRRKTLEETSIFFIRYDHCTPKGFFLMSIPSLPIYLRCCCVSIYFDLFLSQRQR